MSSIFDSRLVSALRNYKPETGVMAKQPEEGWKPEYEQEPPLEAPMISPEDIVQAAPKIGALGVKALVGALKSGVPAIAGSLKGSSLIGDMLKADPEIYSRLLRTKHPETLMRKLVEENRGNYKMNPVPGNVALRYETARPLFDKGVVHYDTVGGKQMLDIMSFPPMLEDDLAPKSLVKQLDANSQIRKANLSDIPAGQAGFTRDDPWMLNYGDYKPKKPFEFYVNGGEGYPDMPHNGMPTPKIRDILNDPDLRKEYNLSLAAPEGSAFHRNAQIIRGVE